MSGSSNTHARRAPSDAKRWTTCTNALDYENMFRLAVRTDLDTEEKHVLYALLKRFKTTFEDARNSGYVEADETAFNKEGTEAHDWAEKVLLGEVKLLDIPESFREPVGVYIQECRRIADESDGFEPFVEAKVPLFYNLTETGTMDYAVVSERRVCVRDYKHGAGIFVEVEENPQLAIYAMSFIRMLEDEGFYRFDPDTEVEIGVVQPRHHAGESVRLWTLSYHDLKTFCANIQRIHDLIDEGIETVFAPSNDACQWCRVKAFCGARLHHLAKGLPMHPGRNEADFLEGLPTYDERSSEQKFVKETPNELDRINHYTEEYGVVSLDQMVKIYSNRKGITAFLGDIEKHLTKLALAGTPAPGTKVVMGRQGNTQYVDENAVIELLEDAGIEEEKCTVTKVVSVTIAKELLGDKVNDKKKKNPLFSADIFDRWASLLTRSPGKKVLALESDKRPSVESNLEGFDEIDDEDDFAED